MLSPHIKLFEKKVWKRGLELVSLPHFSHNFWRKIFLLLYYINWPNFVARLPLLCVIFDNMCIAVVCKPGCEVMNFEVKLIFLIKPYFLYDQKVVTKVSISWERKGLLRWNKKHFSSLLNDFQLRKQHKVLWKVRVWISVHILLNNLVSSSLQHEYYFWHSRSKCCEKAVRFYSEILKFKVLVRRNN